MKINQITAKYTPISFNSNLLKIIPERNEKTNNDLYINTGLLGLAIIGAAAIAVSALNNRNTTPAKVVSGAVKKIVPQKPEITKEQKIIYRLHGRRDFNAKMDYQAYRAKEKSESLLRKYLAGKFSPEVMPYIKANNEFLQRKAGRVL